MPSIFLELSAGHAAAILATYVFAATAKGITGLGFSTTCLPILALVVGLKDALPLVIIPSVCSNLVVMRQAGHFRETVRRFWPMLIALFPGLGAGLWALSWIEGVQAGAILGIVLLLWCAFTFAKPDLRLPAGFERPLAPLSGCLTGLINGVTGSQVMPVVPFLMMLHLERNLFIQALNCSFTLSSFVMAIGLGQLGLFSQDDFLISVLGLGFVFIGLTIGGKIRHRLSETLFRSAIIAMLSVMGVSLVLPALP
ncbi:sulfite exporter TauE/SafE family protein [Ruegeria arenilitoris]|uniref:sulfite exporter TauE/SafE family protein n=1 Tax=Ruegeria arenilitoris TaxID=1173585 RepID=UPI0015802D8E|nr:sulfite exporter TauE/SafE family protein [Ruegeria arenilitoris]